MKKRRDVYLKEYARILHEHGEKYSDFFFNISEVLNNMADVFSVQQTALRYIYENLGHDFEFPKLGELLDTRYGIKTDVYPKEGDPTKWTIHLEVEFVDEEEK